MNFLSLQFVLQHLDVHNKARLYCAVGTLNMTEGKVSVL